MSSQKSTDAALQAICEQGLAFHRAGRLDDARTFYKKVLQRNSKHFNTLHLFGVLCVQAGQVELGVSMLRRAVAVSPNVVAADGILGTVYETLGRFDEALASYDKVIALQPTLDAHFNRSVLLRKMERREEAIASFETTVALAPAFAEAHFNHGLVLGELDRPSEACEAYDRAIAANPGFADAFYNRGLALRALGRPREALGSFDATIVRNPHHAEAHYGRGYVLQALDRWEDAVAAFDQALTLAPGLATAHHAKGLALHEMRRLREAIASFDRALAIAPDYADAHYAKGLVLQEMRRPEEAIASYDRALILRPDHVDTLVVRSLSLLLAGRFAEGWRAYESRLETPEIAAEWRGGDAPNWRGEPLENRVLYLHTEQGLGDTLQFCRYASLIAPSSRVVLEVQAPLKRLLASLRGVRVIAAGEPAPAFDVHCSLLSLPSILATALDTIPADVPYLTADPALVSRWRERLSGLPGMKIGLVWAGGQRLGQSNVAAVDARRSIMLAAMAPLAEVSGMTFVTLQKGPPALQASAPPPGMALVDFTGELNDFADTAALVEALDLVISVDTSVAHLAGAMGKPIWLLNRFDNCWRWLVDRDDSPWYPTLRQFRQPTPGDWSSVMQSVRDALAAYVEMRA